MQRVTFTDVLSLPDLIPTCWYLLTFGVIPVRGANRELSIKTQQVSLPGFTNEAYAVRLHGLPAVHFRGAKTYGNGEMTVQFVEDSKMDTLNTLRQWHEAISGSESGTSIGYKRDYAISPILQVFSTSERDKEIDRLSFKNFFIKEVPETQLSGDQTVAMVVNATFQFDSYESKNVSIR